MVFRPVTCSQLGRVYALSLVGVPLDQAEDARLDRREGDAGVAGAQFRLGLAYAYGRRVARADTRLLQFVDELWQNAHVVPFRKANERFLTGIHILVV